MKKYEGIFEKSVAIGGDKLPPVLVVEMNDTEEFNQLKKIIDKEYFLLYRRPTNKFKKIILQTIGDHSETEEFENSPPEFAITIELISEIDKAMYNSIELSPVYAVTIMGIKEVLSFYIVKEDSRIEKRKLITI